MLVTGSGGLLGSKFITLASPKYKIYSIYNHHFPPAGEAIKLDLLDFNSLDKIFNNIKPDIVLHAAALTNVDLCEKEKDLALKINYEATKRIAILSKKINFFIIYISTDYVFDGEKGLYSEEDKPNPINFYGFSKLKGEEAIIEFSKNYCIIRSSVIYGSKPASGKTNFALWLLENLNKKNKINILIDQYVSPTLNTNLSEMLIEIIDRKLEGIFHLTGAERISRYDFAKEFCNIFNLDSSLLNPISMKDINWIAKRPKDSSLNVSKAINILKTKPLKLKDALIKLRDEINASRHSN